MALLQVRDMTCIVVDPHVEGGTRPIFSGLEMRLERGEIVDLIGPSGSGKSMLLTTLAALNPYGQAAMSLDGTTYESMSPQQWRREVMYLPQRPTLTGETVLDAIRLPYTLQVFRKPATGSDVEAPTEGEIRKGLNELGLADVPLDRPSQELSVGQQARVCLLRSIMTKPKVMLCDEVDAGLDEASAELTSQLLETQVKSGMAILRVRHHHDDGLAGRTLRLSEGELQEVETGGHTQPTGPENGATR